VYRFSPITDKGIYDYADGKYYPAEFRNYTDGTVIKGALSASVEFRKASTTHFSD